MSLFEVLSIIAIAFSFPAAGLATIHWFIVRGLIADMRTLKDQIHEKEVFALNNFAKDVDVKEFMRGVRGTLDTIQSSIAANTNITTGLSVQLSALSENINKK